MATYLITGFYVNSEGSSYNLLFIDAGSQKIFFYKGSLCLLSALIYAFAWSLLQIFSMVRFIVNLICFAVNSRLFFFAITRTQLQ